MTGRQGGAGLRSCVVALHIVVAGGWLLAQTAGVRVWDEDALASMELPLVNAAASARHASADYYYRMSPRPIYKSYPIYAPGREPAGYMEWLAQQEPQSAFDPAAIHTDAEWVTAGEAVFDAPLGYGATFKLAQVRDPAWYERHRIPLTKDGVMPFSRYVVRKKGTVEIGSGSCLMCHARVLADGSLVKGAQGNFPVDRLIAEGMRQQMKASPAPAFLLDQLRQGQRIFFSMPWLQPDPIARIATMSIDEIAAVYEAIPAGATTRVNLSVFTPAQIPDLIGIEQRRYLDHTGIVRQRSMSDLMRYVALVQGANSFDRFADFTLVDRLPDPALLERYTDEQLYALGKYLYALTPPPNPNRLNRASERGQRVFAREGCTACHTPPLYTSNALTPVAGFTPPADHLEHETIINRVVGTDPELALHTRKGTGYYKVPSLKGVWYRGRLQHGGQVGSLEEWLSPSRMSSVPGHPFGLSLNEADRTALIAFLRTL